MPNPYTRFGYSAQRDDEDEEEFDAAPEKSYGTKSTGKTKRRNPYTSFGFSEEEIAPDTSSVDRLLDQGKSWEDISKETGFNLEDVRAYSQQTRPDYGMKNNDKRNLLSKAFDQINIIDSGRSFGRATPSEEGAQKSIFQQGKEVGSSLFSGVEKVGDAVEALTGISERRMKHWDEELRKGNITREVYQKLLENQLKDTEWAGTEDKGTGDRLKKSAGVALEATAEIVPFLKGAKAAQLTTKGGAAFGAGTGLAHGTGSELNNPEGFDWKNVALQTTIGGGAGAVLGRIAQNAADSKLLIKNVTTRRMLDAADGVVEPITDTSRLLSATTSSTRTNLTSRIDEINSQLSDIRTGKTPNTTYQPKATTLETAGTKPTATNVPFTQNTPEGLATGKRGVVTPSATTSTSTKGQQLRALIKERDELTQKLDAVDSGSGPLERVAQINDELIEGQSKGTLTPEQTNNLVTERQTILASVKDNSSRTAQVNADYMEQQLNTTIKNQAALDPNTPDVPTATQRAGKMAGVDEGLPTLGRLSDAQQSDVYTTLKQADPEYVKNIALGKSNPPQGVTAEFIASQEANVAQATKNSAYAKELAQSPVFSQSRVKGQEISSLRTLNQESPITAIKKVMSARAEAAKSGATISKDISDFETQSILDKAALRDTLKDKYLAEIAAGNPTPTTRFRYGQAKVDFDKYVFDLMPGKTLRQWIKNPAGALSDIAGTSKSLRATADVSGILRQGAKLLASGHYKIWAKNTLKSLRTAVKSFGDENVLDAVNANLVSRENYVNGLYKKLGIPVYDVIEEAFPSKALGKVPFLRKIYGASDAAYTSFMQLNRADLADLYIKKAVKAGVDLSSPEGKAIGSFVNSLSSRASLGKAEGKVANVVNNVFFSPRLMKSNFDVLGGHVLTGGGGVHPITGGSNFVRKYAAWNLLKIAATTYSILKIADEVRPNSVEWDPRSSNYGKIKIGNTRFDVTGGMSSLVTLGSRLATQETKSSTTDIISKLNDDENPFSQTTASVLMNFGENKLSPMYSALQDIIVGEDFSGKKPTFGSVVRNLTVPIVADNYQELSKDPNAAPIVASMILEGLGVSTNTYDATDDWTVKPTVAQRGFRTAVGETKTKIANDIANQRFTDWFREIRYGDQYGKMSNKGRKEMLEDERERIEEQVMGEFGYTYKKSKTKKTPQESTDDLLKKEIFKYRR